MLYTYRSVSQAIPEIAIDIPAEMTPEDEQEIATRKSEINRKKEQHKELIPEGIYFSLIKLMDILLILDNLKDIKTCLQKDFSRYKRVLGAHPSIEIIEELNSLQLFLSNPDPKKSKNYIFSSLRSEVKRINNHENIVIEMLELANDTLESIFYLTSNEKFRLIRIQPYLLLVIDGDADDKQSLNVFKSSKIKLDGVKKLFKKNPVIPLYNDMTITLEYILQKAGHYDKNIAAQWSSAVATTSSANGTPEVDPKVVAHYQLTTHWAAIKESYTEFMVRLSLSMNTCNKYPFKKSLADNVTIELSSDVYHMVCEGFQKLSKWNMLIQSMLAWKYTHPVSFEHMASASASTTNGKKGGAPAAVVDHPSTDGIEYARVIKHNFSKEELSVLVDVISCIKSLSALLAKNEAVFAPYIRFHIHHAIQQLVQGDMIPLLHRIDKRNKPILSTLLKLRSIAADWTDGVENKSDYKDYSRNKGTNISVQHTPRVVGTSATQLYILRLQINSLTHGTSELRSKSSMFGKSDLEKSDLELFSHFYEESFYFEYLLNYSATLSEVSSLSELWYREFFLEMTKCIQFPIEMSLPWILIEHLIATSSSSSAVGGTNNMIENIFLVLDIYNDAAHSTLYALNTQYLYDECEAECNLVIDQLYFLLTDLVYNYYKNLAASNLIEKSYKYKLEEIRGSTHLTMGIQRFESILAQRHVQLLGRSINFNYILGQNINNKMYRDIDFAIK
eukprot:gene22832-29006_t